MNPPSDWQATIEEIVRSPGTVMVMGQGDVGKTTFCLLLANAGLERGLMVGVVDADVGQSHIGPPAAIGMGVVERPLRDLGDVSAGALFFVGSHSPGGHFPRMAVGAAKMVARAKGMGLSFIVVDCGGMAMGKFAWRLAKGELEMVRPDHLVLLEKRRGFEVIVEMTEKWNRLTCHRLGLPASVRRKSAAQRKMFRQKAWENYLREAMRMEFSLDSIALEDVPSREADVDWSGWIVGLHDAAEECLGLGLAVTMDWKASRLEVLTPVGEEQKVKRVVFGTQRVRMTGGNSLK
jgi:polynucleotide 5'-hydroxyl-kinase GRC3/NOL9